MTDEAIKVIYAAGKRIDELFDMLERERKRAKRAEKKLSEAEEEISRLRKEMQKVAQDSYWEDY